MYTRVAFKVYKTLNVAMEEGFISEVHATKVWESEFSQSPAATKKSAAIYYISDISDILTFINYTEGFLYHLIIHTHIYTPHFVLIHLS